MFEIYTKEVEINGSKYKIRPLNGRHLPLLYSIVQKVQKNNKGLDLESLSEEERNIKAFEAFDEDTTAKLHKLVFETLKSSYPDKDTVILEEFTSQNLMLFFGVLLEVNLNNGTN